MIPFTTKMGRRLIAGVGALLAVSACLVFLLPKDEGGTRMGGGGDSPDSDQLPERPGRRTTQSPGRPELDSRHLESLLYQRPAEVKEMLAQQDGNRNTLINTLGKLLRQEIESSGDYDKIQKALAQLDPAASRELILAWVMGSSSPKGPVEDFKIQREMAAGLSKGNDTRALSLFYSTLQPEQVSEVLKAASSIELSAPEERELVRASISKTGVEKSFPYLEEVAKSDSAEDQQLLGYAMDQALTQDPHGTANLVSDLPAGPSKDKFSRSLITWLCKVGDMESARKWSGSLSPTDANGEFLRKLNLQP